MRCCCWWFAMKLAQLRLYTLSNAVTRFHCWHQGRKYR
jgi:hypothetical protein